MNELQRSSGMPLTVSLGLVQKIGQGRYGRGVRRERDRRTDVQDGRAVAGRYSCEWDHIRRLVRPLKQKGVGNRMDGP